MSNINGVMQRWLGKVKARSLLLGAGGVQFASGARVRQSLEINLVPLAAANTDLTIVLPSGVTIVQLTTFTRTAYTAGTDITLQIGSSVGAVDYVVPQSIKNVAFLQLPRVAAAATVFANFTLGTLYLRLVQTGTATNVGLATLYCEYLAPRGAA